MQKEDEKCGVFDDVREILARIREKRGALILFRQRKEEIRSLMLPGAIQYDKGKVNATPEDHFIKIIEKLEKVEAQETAFKAGLLEDIETAYTVIAAMHTPEYRRLLKLRYIEGENPLSWAQVAKELEISEEHARGKLHLKALEEAREAQAAIFQ